MQRDPSGSEISSMERVRICRKCLPESESRERYFEKLSSYIADLDESVKVEQQVYEERLRFCASCDKFLDGMCRLCGCFVELRAVQKVRKCPDLPPKWNREE